MTRFSPFPASLGLLLLVCAPPAFSFSTDDEAPLWIDRPEAQPWKDALTQASLRTGIPAGVLAELIGLESGFRNVRNAAGSSAAGFGQQIDGNAVMRACRLDRSKPEDSIMGAALELRARMDRSGSLVSALRGYGTTAGLSPARVARVMRRFTMVGQSVALAARQ